MANANRSLLFFIFTILLILCTTSTGKTLQSAPSPSDSQLQTYIIHVSKSHKPSLYATHHYWYASLIKSISSPSQPAKLLYSYSSAITGFSARLTTAQAAELRRHNAILSVLPERIHHIHTTRTPHFLGLADTYGIWPDADYADDVIIGVLDTGIWPERPSFSDSEMSSVPTNWRGVCETGKDFPSSSCNLKIIGARAFYNGYESQLGKKMNESLESRSPLDTEGHGTHTASTAAGSIVRNASFSQYAYGDARGMAVKARIAVYKICWRLGCFDSDILAAMDQAISDGVHIISLSVGANGHAPEYDRDSIAIGAFGAAAHGVLVSCSAGNSGPGPATAVNIAPWILTVGASTIDREFPADVILGDGRVFSGVSLYTGDPIDSDLELVYAEDAGSRFCFSNQLDSKKVSGKIVICDRGGNARVEKGSSVKTAGGLAMILTNTEESGEELIADSHLIPATMVGQIAGDKIKAYAKDQTQNPTARINFRGTVIGSSPPAPRRVGVFVRDGSSVDCGVQNFSTPGDLNYPSFGVVFGGESDVVKYKRAVKNVGSSGDVVYEVRVSAPTNVEVSVEPNKLVFSGETQKLSYEITFSSKKGKSIESAAATSEFGWVEWSDGTHVVRSPIAVTWLQSSVASF
ncbi:Peptidase S8 propeptide/proteinase inhibitor I9 [Dillenia turbinata]|uniref:Peptidase S8 propeptide/proteinase inhibitor I9 n=1 Tax=Dillenia turbinata TaxID=194707 RepID=A0AAN8YTB0_9MAGN